jgi:ATP-binding cassette subfamily A (ABC1) protein 3
VTAGSVYICREEIQSKLSECQRQIGFCPQYNPLFARLTVREHLRLYARLKTMKKSEELNSEIETIVHQVGLSAKLDTVSDFWLWINNELITFSMQKI